MTEPDMYGGGGPEPMPTTVRLLTATIAVLATTGLFAAAVNAPNPDRLAAAIITGLFGTLAALTAVSLWRAWTHAWHLTIAVAVLAGLGMFAAGTCAGLFGLVMAAGMVWSLNRTETRWWLRRD